MGDGLKTIFRKEIEAEIRMAESDQAECETPQASAIGTLAVIIGKIGIMLEEKLDLLIEGGT